MNYPKPVNGHLLIEPLEHETFMAKDKDEYEEIGIVVDFASDLVHTFDGILTRPVSVGDKVYFDSWLVAKYPKPGGTDKESLWLVPWKDVRAVEPKPQDAA